MRKAVLFHWLWMMVGLFALPLQAAETVVLLLSERGGVYGQFAESFIGAMGSADLRQVRQVTLNNEQLDQPTDLQGASLVVAIGTAAAKVAAKQTVPVLYVMSPRAMVERLLEGGKRGRSSAIYLDQPVSRQLALVRQVLPGKNRVAVLAGPEVRPYLPRVRSVGQRLGFEVLSEAIDEEAAVVPVLNRILPQTDVLLALPDNIVYNRNSARFVLLTSYRLQRPVIAFSQAYVTAGALAAVFSTPQQIARQAADMARSFALNGAFPAPRYPNHFSVVVNRYVARSLGYDIADDSVLYDELLRVEASE